MTDHERTATAIKNEQDDVPCIECLKDGDIEMYKHLHRHLPAKHGMDLDEYRETYPDAPVFAEDFKAQWGKKTGYDVLEANIGTFGEDVVPLSDIEIEDDREKITCRVCGARHRSLNMHVMKHGITTTMYQILYPGAPLVAESTKGYDQIGRYRWRELDVTDAMIRKYEDWILELEDTWVLQDENIFESMKTIIRQDDEQRQFKPLVAASLYVAAKEKIPSVTPDEVASVTGVSVPTMMSLKKRMDVDQSWTPADQLGDHVLSLRGELDETEQERVCDRINAMPDHVKYSRSPSVVVAFAMYDVLNMTQKEAADLMDVTTVSLRNCRDALTKAAA